MTTIPISPSAADLLHGGWKMGYKDGKAEERATIVEWLRGIGYGSVALSIEQGVHCTTTAKPSEEPLKTFTEAEFDADPQGCYQAGNFEIVDANGKRVLGCVTEMPPLPEEEAFIGELAALRKVAENPTMNCEKHHGTLEVDGQAICLACVLELKCAEIDQLLAENEKLRAALREALRTSPAKKTEK